MVHYPSVFLLCSTAGGIGLNAPCNADAHRETFLRRCDEALAAYLTASDGNTAARELARLHKEFIRPAAESALERLLLRGFSRDSQQIRQRTHDFADLCLEVEGDVVLRLDRIRAAMEAVRQGAARLPLPTTLHPIRSLERYVAGVAMHAHANRIRERKPGRYQLEMAVRYVLQHTAGWSLWQQEIKHKIRDWWCGREEWRKEGITMCPLPAPLELPPNLRHKDELRMAIQFVFDTVGAPVRLDDILDRLADSWDVERAFRALPLAEAQAPTGSRETAASEQFTRALRQHWVRIVRLSPRQRSVLLLHTPRQEDEPLLFLFIDAGIAPEQAAASVGLAPDELPALRTGPRLTDETIATRLGITAVQVRSYRQEARRRLRAS